MSDRHASGPVLTCTAFLVVLFLQMPVLVVVLAAFSDTAYLTLPPKGLTLKWFETALSDPDYLDAAWTSLWLAASSTAASLALGLAGACAIHRRMVPGAAWLNALFMAPLALPSVVLGVALLQYYAAAGLRGSGAGLWLAHVVITVPYVVRASLASLASVDEALEDAACVLGAGRLAAFRLVRHCRCSSPGWWLAACSPSSRPSTTCRCRCFYCPPARTRCQSRYSPRLSRAWIRPWRPFPRCSSW